MTYHAIRSIAASVNRRSTSFAIALFACILAVIAWSPLHGRSASGTEQTLQSKVGSPDLPWLDTLRRDAASGDDRSSLELSAALLDRYDFTGNTDDLYEALEWIDRHWDRSADTSLVSRVTSKYCDQRVVRWHRICVAGE